MDVVFNETPSTTTVAKRKQQQDSVLAFMILSLCIGLLVCAGALVILGTLKNAKHPSPPAAIVNQSLATPPHAP